MEALFKVKNRQSLLSVFIFFVNSFQIVIRAGFAFFLLLFIILNKLIANPFWNMVIISLVVLLLVLFLLVFSYKKYQNFLFWIDDKQDEFHLTEGVFQKKSISFHVNQIQQVYIERKWMQRLLGLSMLKIEVPGGQAEAVELKALSNGMANSLLSLLKHMQKQSLILTPPRFEIKEEDFDLVYLAESTWFSEIIQKKENLDTAIVQEERVLRVPLINLLKNALVTKIFSGFIIFLIPLQFLEYEWMVWIFNYLEDNFTVQIIWGPVMVLVLVVLLIVTSVILNLITSVLRYFNLKIEEIEEGHYQISQGLINLKTVQVKASRIQMFKIEQNYIQKLFGLYSLELKQLGDLMAGPQRAGGGIRIPGISKEQMLTLKSWGFLEDWELNNQEESLKPMMRKFWVNTMLFSLVIMVALIVVYTDYTDFLMMSIASGIFVLSVFVIWYFYFVKRESFYVDEGRLLLHRGLWNKVQIYMQVHKIQHVSKHHFFWQRRFVHAQLSTAGGAIKLTFYPQQQWRIIEGRVLYQVESKKKSWY